jgi:hypothetical protein
MQNGIVVVSLRLAAFDPPTSRALAPRDAAIALVLACDI